MKFYGWRLVCGIWSISRFIFRKVGGGWVGVIGSSCEVKKEFLIGNYRSVKFSKTVFE